MKKEVRRIEMKIWVDDIRECPDDYDYWFKSTNETIKFLRDRQKYGLECMIEVLNLDHDAGDYAKYGGDYIKILEWMENVRFECPIRIHSMNPVGRENMRRVIRENGWKEVQSMGIVYFFLGAAVSSAVSGLFSENFSKSMMEYASGVIFAFIALGLFLLEKQFQKRGIKMLYYEGIN